MSIKNSGFILGVVLGILVILSELALFLTQQISLTLVKQRYFSHLIQAYVRAQRQLTRVETEIAKGAELSQSAELQIQEDFNRTCGERLAWIQVTQSYRKARVTLASYYAWPDATAVCTSSLPHLWGRRAFRWVLDS